MFINGKYTKPICPICALALRNKIHGLNDKEFVGTMANEYLREARKLKGE